MPGLVNTHTHAPMVLFRGLADDLALMDWLNKYIFPAEAKTVSPEFVRVGHAPGRARDDRVGTTTFVDMYYFEEEVAKETKAAGLRGVLGQTIIQFPVADAKTPADGSGARGRVHQAQFKGDPLITPAVAPHAIYTLDGPTLKAARELSKQHGVPMLIHVAETSSEAQTAQERFSTSPVAYLDSLGVLGPGVLAAHGVWVNDADIAILKSRGVGVSHNPESNMKLASGTAPVTAYLRAGVALGLGTDGAASNNDLDMFEAMRTASLLAKLQTVDSRRGARRHGARDGDDGRGARPGHGAADRVARATQARRHHRRLDALGASDAALRSGLAPRLRDARRRRPDVIVNGKIVMRDRRVLTLDAESVLKDARAMALKVKAAVK